MTESSESLKRKSDLEWCMGIDEAGRGPVLGPMVYGCCAWPVSYEDELKQEGFNDSKQLTEEKRDFLFSRMEVLQNEKLYYEVRVLSARFLSNRMLAKQRDSLNQLSFDAAYSLIDSVMSRGFNVTHIFIDTVGKKETYQARLENDYRFKYPGLRFTVSEKADSKWPVVGAASICAKVTRDREIKINSMIENITLPSSATGSGYPSDPATKKWLQDVFDKVFGFPSNVRFSWSTVENVFADKGLEINFYDDSEESSTKPKKGQKTITQSLNHLAPKAIEQRGYFAKTIGITRNFDL